MNEKVFYTVAMDNRGYAVAIITFNLFEKLYADAIKQYLYDPDAKMMRQMFYFTITSITPKNNYSIDNAIFNAIII